MGRRSYVRRTTYGMYGKLGIPILRTCFYPCWWRISIRSRAVRPGELYRTGIGGKGVTMFTRMYTWLQVRLQDEEGATAVEYALMVALIAVVIIAAVTVLGKEA